MLIIDLEKFMIANSVISYVIFILVVGNLYYTIVWLVEKIKKRKRIPYSLDLYLTGKYRVVTRDGHKVIVKSTTPNLLVTIPTKETCRGGHYDYGYMPNGQWDEKVKHELDLFLIKKWFV